MSRQRRLLVLALDAASPELLISMMDAGTLPTLAELRARGRHARTESIEGFYVGATWPSFSMGRGPGQHGLYWLDRLLPGTYRTQRAGPEELAPLPTLWDRVAEAGHETLVMDVPLTAIDARRPGVQVVEWGVHDAVFGFQTNPPLLRDELLERFGRHPAPPQCDAVRDPAQAEEFAEQLETGAATRASLTLELLERSPDWRFAIQVFSETHCAGHQLWHTHDPSHPGWQPGCPDLVERVYRAVDSSVETMLRGVGADTTVAVMALHGMGSSGGHSLLLREVLLRLGIETPEDRIPLADPPRAGNAASPGRDRDAVSLDPMGMLKWAYRAVTPKPLRERVYERRQRWNDRHGRGSPIDIDPSRTRAFVVGLGTGAPHTGIRLNLRGREPQGVLEPGRDAAEFVRALSHELGMLTDPRTGHPAVARVLRSEELFEGPCVGDLPDLLVEWTMTPPRGSSAVGEGDEALWEVESPAIGRVSLQNGYCRTGEHRREGWVVLAGPDISPGQLERRVSILELSPTFGALLDVPTPGMETDPAFDLMGTAGAAPPS